MAIAVLPSAVADQIAAGEVVERPASVVKELIENSIDAGATMVDVTIETGGHALIRVSDNGSGMDRRDAVLSLERHATSKITSAEQLVGVRSFGFRGEALPAICSVSELDLETSREDGAGTHVNAAAGSVRTVTDIARRRGTTVSVARLFYNTPARQKFLRSARSEWRSIAETLGNIAVLRRDVHITARHDGKQVLDLPVAPTLRARVAALWGHREIERFVDVDDVQGVIRVTGLAERPADVGTATRRVLLIINGRLIRDHGLIRAAEAAYRSTLPSGVRPSLLLEITLPGDSVDVNVHPAKSEVRLRDRWPVERAVENAIRRALGIFDASAGIGWRTWNVGANQEELAAARHDASQIEPDQLHARYESEGLFAAHAPSFADTHAANMNGSSTIESDTVGETRVAPRIEEPISVPPLVQLKRTYLMFEHEDGTVLIDQHSAHERVLYEEFMGTLTEGRAPSQRLLFPLTLHLNAAEADAFEANRESLRMLGFEMEGFGGNTLLVNAVPMPHPRFDAERCLRDTLAALTGDRAPSDAKRHERLAATVACKAAIKAGDVLSQAEMRALYIALAQTTLPAHDVHGRATIVRLSWDEIDRRFGRR
ncbi:MAG: DNA mismatch repair endonuclease MutL [Gemmatimonas sp.]